MAQVFRPRVIVGKYKDLNILIEHPGVADAKDYWDKIQEFKNLIKDYAGVENVPKI